MTEYRAIFIDVDMTLTGPDRLISRVNADAVDAARQAGLAVVVCTGRCYTEAVPAFRQLPLGDGDLAICAGGALVSRVGDGATIHRRSMEPAARDATAAAMSELGVPMLMLQDVSQVGYDYRLVLPGGDWPLYDRYRRISTTHFGTRFCEVPRWTPGAADDTLRISMVAEGKAGDPIRQRLEAMQERAHWHDLFYPDTDLRLLEVFGCDVNKGTAMRWVCERQGWPIEWTASIGDDINDVPMMTAGGLGVAMGNAHADVLAVADHVTAGHDADGVARAITAILAGEFDPHARRKASA
ncbi:MAG: Sugar phosphatase YidA [Phycisphaerae bacterium]|nr:Sugar phosphatase YidA [Phycisphaerae bacterium]